MPDKKEPPLTEPEIAERFEVALRGARIASPTPMKDIPRKRKRKDRVIADPEGLKSP